MKTPALALLLLTTPALADEAANLCRGNPAYSQPVMLAVIREQLAHDHDPGLDADTPEKLADQAVEQGVSECAAELRGDPTLTVALSGLTKEDSSVGWDAYNTACADHKTSKGQCVQAEIGSAKALKHLMGRGAAPGTKTLVQACQLVMAEDPAMVEWRTCVDTALAVRPSEARAQQCKLSANWHVAKTGAEAGALIAACLRGS